MRHWFRYHIGTLDSAKIQKLSGNLFKHWLNTLCVSTKADLPDGRLPSLEDTAHQLHLSEKKATAVLGELRSRELLDETEDGWYRVHDWNDWQYKGDVSTERVKRFRNRKKHPETVSVTPTPHAHVGGRSESESVSESSSGGGGPGEGSEFAAAIEQIADVYPNGSQFQLGIQRLTERSDSGEPWLSGFVSMARAWSAYWRESSNGRSVAACGAPKFADFVENYRLIYSKSPPKVVREETALEKLRKAGQPNDSR